MTLDNWKNHFKMMSDGKIPPEEIYVINQKGRGIGTNKKNKILYKVQKRTGTGSTVMVTPVAQGIAQAKSKLKRGIKRLKTKSKNRSRKSGQRVKVKNNKKRKTTKTKRSKKKVSNKKKNYKDIFG